MLLCAQAFADESQGDTIPNRVPRDTILSSLFQAGEGEQEQGEEEKEEKQPESDSHSFGLPGWWGHEKTARSSSSAFLPFYYRYKDPEFSIKHFWPVYGRKTKKYQYDTHYSLWPFLRYTTYESGATQVDFPWPFLQVYGGGKEFRAHLLPILWVNIKGPDEGSVVLFPIFFHHASPQSRTTVLFPIYWDLRVPEGGLWHLWPLYGYSKAPGWHRTLFGFPLLRYTRRWDPDKPVDEQPADRQVDLLWPFIKLRLGPLNKQFHFFPFYYGKTYYRDAEDEKIKLDKRYCYLPPVFWYYCDREEVHFHLWPFGISRTHDGDEKILHIAFPLLWIHTIKSTKVLEISIPAFLALFKYESRPFTVTFEKYSTKGRDVAVRLYPFFSYRSNPMLLHLSVNPIFTYNWQLRTEKDAYTRLSVVGGLIFMRQSFRNKLSWQLLAGLASYNRSEIGDKHLRILYWTYKRKKDKSSYQFEPLFRYAGDKKGYDFRILTGLFGFGRRGEDSYVRLLWFLKL
jgi:hypothetical protein